MRTPQQYAVWVLRRFLKGWQRGSRWRPHRWTQFVLWGKSLLFATVGLASLRLSAEEIDGLTAALAIQERLVAAIARSERSVVAVARIRKTDRQSGVQAGGAGFQPPFPPQFTGEASPMSEDFIPQGFGAGVVIDASGLILTSYHVLGDVEKSEYFVWSQHRPFHAKVVSADGWFDLAVLRVAAADLFPVRFGDAKQLRKGHIVIALGNPYAIARDGEVSASWGIVSNLLRRAPRVPERSNDPLGRETLHQYGSLIQTDTRLNSGYSGGALVNLEGEMVGMTTSYAAGVEYDSAAGLAIPVDEHFRRTVDILKAGGRPAYGFLGIGPESLSEQLRRQGVHGTRIVNVVAGTPAARADLRIGDVITHVNQQPVYDDDDLFRLVGSLAPGMAANLRMVRGDLDGKQPQVAETTVTVTKKWTNTRRPQLGSVPLHVWRGIQVDYATASPGFNYLGGQINPQTCVYVSEVTRDSPAWQAGLRTGVYISRVGSQPTTTPEEFYAATSSAEGNIELTVLSGQVAAAHYTVSP